MGAADLDLRRLDPRPRGRERTSGGPELGLRIVMIRPSALERFGGPGLVRSQGAPGGRITGDHRRAEHGDPARGGRSFAS